MLKGAYDAVYAGTEADDSGRIDERRSGMGKENGMAFKIGFDTVKSLHAVF